MTYRLFRAWLLFWLIFPLLLEAQTNQQGTNVEIFQKLVNEIVREVSRDAGIDSSCKVIFQSRSENISGDWLVENGFIRYFLSQNIPVQMSSADKDENSFLLEFSLAKLNVFYQKISSKKIARNFVVNIDARVTKGKEQSVVLLKEFSKTFQDTISYQAVNQVESARYPFTHADMPESKNFKKWISPAVALVSTGVVIYSFFALRSK